MLKKKENKKKIIYVITALILTILMLGIYIKINYEQMEKIEISSISAKELKKNKSGWSTVGFDRGTIKPTYKPEWEKVSSTYDKTAKTLTINLRGKAYDESINYASNVTSTLQAEDITVFMDGVEVTSTTNPTVTITSGKTETNSTTNYTEALYTIVLSNLEEATRRANLPYKELSGNVSIKIRGRGENSSTYSANVLVDDYGNQSMMESDENQTPGTWINVTTSDAQTDRNTINTMFADFIKPEFTYEAATTTIDYDTKTLTAIFSAVDKYFDSANSSLTLADLKLRVDGELVDINVTGNSLTEEAVYADDGTTRIGTKYTLVVKNLQKYQGNENDSFTYSGVVSIAIPAGKFKDLSGNSNDGTTLTIGVDEKDGNPNTSVDGNGTIVDVVDPVWRVQNLQTTTVNGVTTATMDLIATDKFFKQSTLKVDDIQIKVAGVNITTVAPELQKTLSQPTYIKWDNSTGTYTTNRVTQSNATGVKYTFSITHLEESSEAFFAERAKYATNPSTGRLYREYSGLVEIIIPAGTVEDKSGNKNLELVYDQIGHIDTLKPEIVKVSSTSQKNETNVELSKHIVVFDIVDKFIDTSSITTSDTSKIHVYLDGEEATSITKKITNIEQLNATVNGALRKVGYRYTLELSNFEKVRTSIDYTREYTDWSGDLTIKIDANVAYDVNPTNTSDRRGNDETILAGNEANTSNLDYADFVDYIKPDATYEYSDTDVKETAQDGKTFSMTFDITDKFYQDSTLSISDLQVLISAEGNTGTGESKYDDLTNNPKVGKSLRVDGTIENVVNGVTKVIGKRYTLVLTNLEQVQKTEGNRYLDYSGAITLIIPKDKVKDTSGNGNDATSITSGVNIPGGEITDVSEIDVVAPLWERTGFTTDMVEKIATISLLGTDKYFSDPAIYNNGNGTLTLDEVKLFVNGVETTGNFTISDGNKLYEERIVLPEYGDGSVSSGATTETVQYGVEYTLTIKDFPIDANQVKIQLVEGSLIDKSNNKSKATEFLLYNTLVAETNPITETSPFLGEIPQTNKTAIARQDIEKVVFVNSTEASTNAGVQNVWDVSSQRDSSILAWYSETSAPYTVYIGSNDDIYGNVNSQYLFAYIGYSEACTSTTAVENLELLHTINVTKMNNMFSNFGYRKMESLVLPDNFDTRNVTDMSEMFFSTGYTAMTSLVLPDNFDTRNVTDMSEMFFSTGYTAMTSLVLPDNFDTRNVTNMYCMFHQTGYTAMTSLDLRDKFDTSNVTNMESMFAFTGVTAMISLDLGDKFDTSNVTNMGAMFAGTGYKAMTSLSLGNKFDTSNVTNMNGMFNVTGYESTSMTSLDLGDKFYTSSVTDMTAMFEGCGSSSMTSLDLGPAFTNIAATNTDMFSETGKSGAIIYVPESIYKDMKHCKLSTDSTTSTEEYTVGTINAKYKPEWSKISSSLANNTLVITVKGNVDPVVYNGINQNITSAVKAGNDGTNQINILVDGESAEDITQNIEVLKNTETEVQYKITLSNFEKSLRKSGKNFKEWSGNVALQFAKGSLKDAYGNKNMIEIDVNAQDLTQKEPIQIKDDTLLEANVAQDKMFADFIGPEFTYEYSNTIIGSGPLGDKKVIVVFDVTDKYFDSTDLSTDTLAQLITVRVDEDIAANTTITKQLTKLNDLYYNVNGNASHKVGERYQLVIDNLETKNGEGYSGPMTLSFPAGIIKDKTENKNIATTITIGIDEPANPEHPDHNQEEVVDVVNPIWVGLNDVNQINRTNDTVDIIVLGNDKYYESNTLAPSKIKVYVDGTLQNSIVKTVTQITNKTTLQGYATKTGLSDVKVGYTVTLSKFEKISGVTKIVIDAGTIKDTSGNVNLETTINAGNIIWVEENEPLQETDANYPRYPAFRSDIVDFIDPAITYTYSTVEETKNPIVDYVAKTVTVKFKVSDKYLLASDLINADNTVKNMKIIIGGEDRTSQVTTRITADSADISDGEIIYTLVVSNIEQTPNNGFDFSGVMQLLFTEGAIEDTSGNTNNGTTITLDTEIGNDIVDVVDPIVDVTADGLSARNTENRIDRTQKTVTVLVQGVDKYISVGNLITSDFNSKVKVRVEEHDGDIIEDASAQNLKLTKADGTVIQDQTVLNQLYTTRIVKTITRYSTTSTVVTDQIVLSNFGEFEGKVTLVIPKGAYVDSSGNENLETEVLVGNSSASTAFKDSIVDFTAPTWNYATSSINRMWDDNGVRIENGTVTLKIIGYDNYYISDSLTATEIDVFVNGTKNTSIQKNLQKITSTQELTDLVEKAGLTDKVSTRTITDVVVGYTLTLSNFRTNDGVVKIQIPRNKMYDTSDNGNILTEIKVGNPESVETDVETDTRNPIYTAFRDSIVDFIKPVIRYQYEENVNPILDRENETVSIKFTSTDTNYMSLDKLSTNLVKLNDMKIYIDDMLVYGTGADDESKITAELSYKVIDNGTTNGIEYTLKLSALELNKYLTNEIFERHSGVIRLEIPANQVADTSGNKNIATTIIVDTDNGDSRQDGIIVDFVNPNIYFRNKYINWEKRYALIALRATDRFYDNNTKLAAGDLILYKENENGEYIQIPDFDGKIEIYDIANSYGYDFAIRLDDFEQEYKLKIKIPAGKLRDTSGNYNDETEIIIPLDNRKPTWEYVSEDTSTFVAQGNLSFTVKGKDKFLDMDNSKLEVSDLKIIKDGQIYLDGTNAGDASRLTVTSVGTDANEKSKTYKISISGITEIGTFSLIIGKDTLVDEFANKSATTTISFSKSAISANTGNYTNITYHITPDQESVHKSYINELMSVNKTGTNFENTTYRPSTIGELNNKGENSLFAEPMYDIVVNGYDVSRKYAPKSFAGWAEADANGNITGKTYGLYEEIPNTVTNLKAVWQEATIVFVSKNGNDSNDGKLPESPVKTLTTAFSKLNSSGTAGNNIIIIMNEIEWNSSQTLEENATITSLYAGVDYETSQNAELKISSNMIIRGNIIFDNIKLYSNSNSNMLISNYSGDITLGRNVSTPDGKYTFGSIIGGNYSAETKTGELGTHTIRVEAGRYEKIVAGSLLDDGNATTISKSITHNVVIGNMKDAAVSKNDKLTITGYVAIGENEKACYPQKVTNTANAIEAIYANVTLYSGTFTSGNTAIYLRSINGATDGIVNFEMYGGAVTGNIYGGSRVSTSYEGNVFNKMNFYGGQVTGNIFGQGLDTVFTGSTEITLQGIIAITGDIFGGSNTTTATNSSVGRGNSTITLNSSSARVSGNVYGGGNITTLADGYITGTTNIILNAGTVSNIYGSGYNCGNTGATNITIENGTVNENIYGGAKQNQARNVSNITALGGTISGNIYGGNDNISSQLDEDAFFQKVNIVIGDTDETKAPTINGIIFGGGKNDKIDVAKIELIECANITSVFGGSEGNGLTITSEIYLKGMTVNEIYGGAKETGSTNITSSISKIYLQTGTATDVYGGGYKSYSAESHVDLEGTAVVISIYGGPYKGGKVTTTNVTLKSGTVTNVFGGGNSAEAGVANVELDGITIGKIHGGSKDSGLTVTTNVTLKTGTVTDVFGGGLDAEVTTANVKHQGATVTNIYGGNDSSTNSSTGGKTDTTNIEIKDSIVENVYGASYLNGTTRYTNINIHGTSEITGDIYGGGYKSTVGSESAKGLTTINIAKGTIRGNINGGSNHGVVYGDTNINVGYDAIGNASLTPGATNIIGTIYGAGSTLTSGEITVYGNTNITLYNGTVYPISYYTQDGKEKSIYGSGKGGAIYSNDSDRSMIHLKGFGTADNLYLIKSIEDTGNLYIGNSTIELTGELDKNALITEVGNYYTLNTISNGLTIYDNTTLHTKRGFNKVASFYSYVNQKTTKATVTIKNGVATTNVNNKIYTLEGVNIIFARKEVTLSNKSTLAQSDWGEVKGMTFFGMYKNTLSGKQYDTDLFRAGTYVEGQYDSRNNINSDGFYTETNGGAQIIETVNYTNYCDWIINAPTINYDIGLIASTYGQHSVAELLLDYKYSNDYTYSAETIYTLNQVSSNSLRPGISLVDKAQIPTISENANTTFGLTMETTNSGWKEQSSTTILSSNNGEFTGDTVYKSDGQNTPGVLKFRVYNSLNITDKKDLGLVTIKLIGQQPASGSGAESYTFNVVIAVNVQTIIDDLKDQYTPSFTGKFETELNYTADSKVDLSYILYNVKQATPYQSGDYRVISTTMPLPAKTKLTLKDYGQGDNLNKVYYYQVATNTDYYKTEVENGTTRYLYKLTKFAEMGSTNDLYQDITTYYHSTEKYVLEKYDLSIDFIDADVDTNVGSDVLANAQETYLELRNASESIKYDNGDTTIKYNLKTNQNAVSSISISNEGEQYSVVKKIEIPISIDSSLLQREGVLDTKYNDKIIGIGLQVVGENNVRVKTPVFQDFKLINNNTGEIFDGDSNGTIRIPLVQGFGSQSAEYTLTIEQYKVAPGGYRAQVFLYTADDGKYYGSKPETDPVEFYITFISRETGLIGVTTENDASRIISTTTGLNLVDDSTTSKAIDMTIGISNPTSRTSIRIELYKRNATYTDLTDENTYTGTVYELVDIKNYLQGSWTEAASGSKEYIISPSGTYDTDVKYEEIEFERGIIQGISTGEYKLLFKVYDDDALVQEFGKTFIVIP